MTSSRSSEGREGGVYFLHVYNVHLHSTAAWHGVYWVIGGVMSRSRLVGWLVLRRRKKETDDLCYLMFNTTVRYQRSTFGLDVSRNEAKLRTYVSATNVSSRTMWCVLGRHFGTPETNTPHWVLIYHSHKAIHTAGFF